AFVTDTAPTQAIWDAVHAVPHLRAVFLELTFPDDQAWLAHVSKHLTPALFAAELRKLPAGVPVYVIHVKARYHPQVVRELAALGQAHVSFLEPGCVLEIGAGRRGKAGKKA